MEHHYYKSGARPFYVSLNAEKRIVEGCVYDARTKAMQPDMAQVMSYLFIASEETECISQTEFEALLASYEG